MIDHLAYLGVLLAPEMASAAADAAGSLVEKTGRRLAAGMADELGGRLSTGGTSLFGAVAGFLERETGATLGQIQARVTSSLTEALEVGKVSLVQTEELSLLRELAVAIAGGSDTAGALSALKAFHERQATAQKDL